MNKHQVNDIRRMILVALRHDPSSFDLRMDSNGWVDIPALGDAINIMLDCEQDWDAPSVLYFLNEIGLNDRVQFRSGLCRAAYGHSTPKFEPNNATTPDGPLFHGTSSTLVSMIELFGLQPRSRRFVQLTTDFDYALEIATNGKGQPVVFQIQSKIATELGVSFYPTGSHVWLSTPIPADSLQLWMTEAPIDLDWGDMDSIDFDQPSF
jgi:putative RNA 2'-phosphotransferase